VPLLERILASNEVLAAVIAVILTALIALVGRFLTPRGRIAWGVFHEHLFVAPEKVSGAIRRVYTRYIWVQNIGRATADGVEVVFNYSPQHFEVWPQRQFERQTNAQGNTILRFPELSRGEHFGVSLLSVDEPIPDITNVRWSDGVGRRLPMAPQRAWSPTAQRLFLLSLGIGLVSTLFVVVRLIQWIFV
jgi:hypothetical protein